MAALTHVSAAAVTTDFFTAFGTLPQVSRAESVEQGEDGRVVRTHHRITIRFTVRASGGTTDARQADLTAKMAAFLAIAHGGSLSYTENDSGQSWSYDNPGAANDITTLHGLVWTSRELPYSDAHGITNFEAALIAEADVFVCANDPITGVATFTRTRTTEWDEFGLVSVTYSGRLCGCDGQDTKRLVELVRDTIFTPDARALWLAQGITLGAGFGPRVQSFTSLDSDNRCYLFSFTYGGGDVPQGSDAEHLAITADSQVKQNLVTLRIQARYTYRGNPPTSPAFPPILPPFLGAALTSWDAVKLEASRFQGVNPPDFYPPGSGTAFLVEDLGMAFDLTEHTITATRVYLLNWIWGDDVVEYDETITIEGQRPALTAHTQSPTRTDARPFPYPQIGGYNAAMVRFDCVCKSRVGYRDIPPRLAEDPGLVFRIVPETKGAISRRAIQANLPTGAGLSTLYETRQTFTYLVTNLAQVAALQAIPVGDVTRATSIITPGPSASATPGGFSSA